MRNRVDEACRQVIGEPTIFPEGVRQAATRLKEFFGDRRLGSIGRGDFSAYVDQCGRHAAWAKAARAGGPVELACYDLHILGTIAGFSDEIALWELIRIWIEENHAAIAGARP